MTTTPHPKDIKSSLELNNLYEDIEWLKENAGEGGGSFYKAWEKLVDLNETDLSFAEWLNELISQSSESVGFTAGYTTSFTIPNTNTYIKAPISRSFGVGDIIDDEYIVPITGWWIFASQLALANPTDYHSIKIAHFRGSVEQESTGLSSHQGGLRTATAGITYCEKGDKISVLLQSASTLTVEPTWVSPLGGTALRGVLVSGCPGVDGASAYDVWLEEGNVGTVQDFLDSLKGEDGEQGTPTSYDAWEKLVDENLTDLDFPEWLVETLRLSETFGFMAKPVVNVNYPASVWTQMQLETSPEYLSNIVNNAYIIPVTGWYLISFNYDQEVEGVTRFVEVRVRTRDGRFLAHERSTSNTWSRLSMAAAVFCTKGEEIYANFSTSVAINSNDFSVRTRFSAVFTGGAQGDEGKSTYDLWIESGNSGTVEDFLRWVKAEAGGHGNIGEIFWWPLTIPPGDSLYCDGSEISRETYQDLFDVIGTTFGNGDGLTTFNLPDMRGEFIRGYDPLALRDFNGSKRGIGQHQESTSIPNISVNGTYNLLSGVVAANESNSIANADGWITNPNAKYYNASSVRDNASNISNLRAKIQPTNINMLPCIRYKALPNQIAYFPDYANVDPTPLISVSGETWIADKDGFVSIYISGANIAANGFVGLVVYVDDIVIVTDLKVAPLNGNGISCSALIPISRNQVLKVVVNSNGFSGSIFVANYIPPIYRQVDAKLLGFQEMEDVFIISVLDDVYPEYAS